MDYSKYKELLKMYHRIHDTLSTLTERDFNTSVMYAEVKKCTGLLLDSIQAYEKEVLNNRLYKAKLALDDAKDFLDELNFCFEQCNIRIVPYDHKYDEYGCCSW